MPGLWLDPSSLNPPPGSNSNAADTAAWTASYILWALTGRKYDGLHTATDLYVPPCRGACGCLSLSVAGDGSTWVSGRTCSCRSAQDGLWLRNYPARSVTTLSHGSSGALIDPSEYELANRRVVRPTSPLASWSPCETLKVTYTFGAVPPRAGQNAAWIFANELLLAGVNATECRLPREVTSISREGITMTIPDPQTFIEQGRTGIVEVDLFIGAANPSKAKMRARILTPDRPRRFRRTT